MTTTTPSTLTRAGACAATLLLTGALFGGCTTVEKINGVEYPVEDSPREDETEVALLEAIEDNDDNLQAWYALGEHYEKGLRNEQSYNAFLNFQFRLDAAEKKQKIELPQRATLGLNSLARVAIKLRSPDLEAICIEQLKRQPKSLKLAKHNPHFRLAHLRLARIYFAREENEQAHLHAMIHKELGGKDSDGILIGLDERSRQREKKGVVQPSHEQGQAEKSKPAGRRK